MVRNWLLLVGAACLLGAVAALAVEEPPPLRPCSLPPKWKVNGFDPMKKIRKSGNMTVLAIMSADYPYSRQQARRLQKLQRKFEKKGIFGISYIIINTKESEHSLSSLSSLVKIPVYQDKSGDIVKKLHGSRNEFFIYDKCGRLSYHLHHDVSYLSKHHVSNAILFTHHTKRGCKEPCEKLPVEGKKMKATQKPRSM